MAEKRPLLVTVEQEAALSAMLRDHEESLKGLEFVGAGGISVQRHGKRVNIVGRGPANKQSPPQIIQDAIITQVAAINGGIRARYTVHLGHWDMTVSTSTGGKWVESTATDFTAYNSAEDKNTFASGTGTIGTGNTAAQSDGAINSTTCKMKFLPVGAYVTVKVRGADATGKTYYTIINAMNSGQ